MVLGDSGLLDRVAGAPAVHPWAAVGRGIGRDMSVEAAERFLRMLSEDSAVAAELAALEAGEDRAVELTAIVELAQRHGFRFTVAE